MAKKPKKTAAKTKGMEFSAEQRQAYLNAYYSSRENRADFARKHGLSYNTLYTWTRKYENQSSGVAGSTGATQSGDTSSVAPLFAQLDLPNNLSVDSVSWGWELCLRDGVTLRIGNHVREDTVIRLVQALSGGK